ncbi:hypothetical protein J2Z50_006562 [Ensifer mexicanus]|nr:hypothetical protein [Sinorhizobium mexicanum]
MTRSLSVGNPKPPSSAMETDWDAFEDCLRMSQGRPRTVLKIDEAYAKPASARYPHLPV